MTFLGDWFCVQRMLECESNGGKLEVISDAATLTKALCITVRVVPPHSLVCTKTELERERENRDTARKTYCSGGPQARSSYHSLGANFVSFTVRNILRLQW
jgi:hypothetical protein